MTILVKNKNLTKSLFQKSIFSRSNTEKIPVFRKNMGYLCYFFVKNNSLEQKICRSCFAVLYLIFDLSIVFNIVRDVAMYFGMSDPWVALAYLGNIAVTLACVIYGIICYNSGDDSEEKR